MGCERAGWHFCALCNGGCVFLEQSSICDIHSLNDSASNSEAAKENQLGKNKKGPMALFTSSYEATMWVRDQLLTADLGGKNGIELFSILDF